MTAEADRLREELVARRACLEGAQQTLGMVVDTLRDGQSLEHVRAYLEAPVVERMRLVEEAIRNTDAALG